MSGNHEYIRDREIFFEAIRSAGITILRNEKIDMGGIDSSALIGTIRISGKICAILEEMDIPKTPAEHLLRHVPDNLDIAEHAGISLQLSGHTHRGQFWPLSLFTHYFYHGFDYGFHYFKKMAVYTSSGVGTWMSPFRFGTKSEIVVVEFE